MTKEEAEEVQEYRDRLLSGRWCRCNVTVPPCAFCEATVTLPCESCGDLHMFHHKSYEAQGVLSVFCPDCEDPDPPC
jgi:hypothetical protein